MYQEKWPSQQQMGSGLCEPQRDPAVTSALSRVMDNFCNIESAVEMLRDRMHPVLGMAPPQVGTEANRALEPVLPPMAQSLRNLDVRITEINSQLRDLFQRLEL